MLGISQYLNTSMEQFVGLNHLPANGEYKKPDQLRFFFRILNGAGVENIVSDMM